MREKEMKRKPEEKQRNKDRKEKREAGEEVEKGRKKNVIIIITLFQECKTADDSNLLFSPRLLPPLTDSGEARNNADYHNCLKCL